MTIYTLCLLGMRHIGFKQEIGLDRLVERIARIVGPKGKSPDGGTIKRALHSSPPKWPRRWATMRQWRCDPKTERVYFLDPSS
ncbi:MAG: hypothetical protein ACKVP3_12150 [Hyphomicrobiaceae bacterium]